MPVQVNEWLVIPDEELSFSASRSGGPGGQNVNKVNSRVMLRFDLAGSGSLSAAQKQRIASRLATRIDHDGVLRVVAQRHRSQAMNREAAVQRLAELLREALHEEAPRIDTRPTRAARERRIAEKTHRGSIKRERRARIEDD